MDNKRILFLDILRIFASFAVITIHTCTSVFSYVENKGVQWYVCNFWDSLSRYAVPIFFMISGSLLLDGSKSISIHELLKKRIPKVIRIYVIWSFVYAAVDFVNWSLQGSDIISSAKSALFEIINGHYHLWYLWAIMGLYLVLPFLKAISADRSIERYFIVLGIIFAIAIPQITSICEIIQRAEFINTLGIYMVLGYTSYFLLGHYLFSRGLKKTEIIISAVLAVAGILVTFYGTIIYSTEILDVRFYSYNTLNVLVVAVFIFVLTKKICESIENRISKKLRNTVTFISKQTLGIYTIHVLIIDILSQTGLFLIPNVSWFIPAISFFVFFISFICVKILAAIPLGTYIVYL